MAKACSLFCAFDAARLLIVSLGLIRTPLTSLSNMDPAVFSFLIKAEPRGKEKKKFHHWRISSYRCERLQELGEEAQRDSRCSCSRCVEDSRIACTYTYTQHYHLHFKTEAGFLLTPSIDYLISVMKRREEGKKQHLHFSGSADSFSVENTRFASQQVAECIQNMCAEQKRD